MLKKQKNTFFALGLLLLIVLFTTMGIFTESILNLCIPGMEEHRITDNSTTHKSEQWQQVESVVMQTRLDQQLKSDLVAQLASTRDPVELYIGSLILFTEKEYQQSYFYVSKIDINSIPAEYLYFPYRLHQLYKLGLANPYLPGLISAAKNNYLPSLIKARVLGQAGELSSSLQSYMQTDPTKWRNIDFMIFQNMINHDGLKIDTQRMLHAAWNSGRLTASQTRDIKTIVLYRIEHKDELQNIKHRLKGNEDLLLLAKSSFIDMTDSRRLFMQKQYPNLLNKHKNRNPDLLGTELITLLFLAAAKQKNTVELEQWGQEIKRRFPESRTQEWVEAISSAST